jgi:CheY-like chemotaxis protein
VTLPLREAGSVRPPHQPVETLAAQHLLLVEDDLVTREVTAALLESHGHRVSVAADGEAALQAARSGGFHAILLDLQLGGAGEGGMASGLVIARRIRDLPGAAGAVRIVALTADGLSTRRAECRAAGLDGLLIKPMSLASGLDAALARAALALAEGAD